MSYTLKEQLANPRNYGGSRAASQIRYLVYHYTGNDGDMAANNAKYFQNNIVKASAHYFVDDTTVWRSVPDLKVAWSVGGSKYANADKTGGGTMYGVITNTCLLYTSSIASQIKDGLNFGNVLLGAIGGALAGGALGGYFAFRKNLNPAQGVLAVSYTHLDVYKRQASEVTSPFTAN